MNITAVRILFMKDLFLCRKYLFGYLVGGLLSVALACAPNETLSFVGFIMMITVAIASGMHMIGTLLLGETTEQTRLFVFSLPVSLWDHSLSKIAVVLTTFLIPWSLMFILTTIFTFVLPWSKPGAVVVLPAVFCFLLAGFTVQLVTAVVSDSIGWTIGVMVACNVAFNVFLIKLHAVPGISEITKSDSVTWPTELTIVLLAQWLIIAASIAIAFFVQTRQRDLV